MSRAASPLHAAIVAVPESSGIPLQGIFESLSLVGTVVGDQDGSQSPVFNVETVGPRSGIYRNVYGLPIEVQRSVEEVPDADLVVIGSVIPPGDWETGRYDSTVEWISRQYSQGATVASACTGAFLLAETGLLDGRRATTHWAFAPAFRRTFPAVDLRVEGLIVPAGDDTRIVTAGGASAWQDLVIHLIARHVNAGAAAALARFFLYHSIRDTQAPYISFPPSLNHEDDVIRNVEQWIQVNVDQSAPVEAMAQRSGLASRTFERRFKRATGFTPLEYVQNLRIEQAKRMLEESARPVEDIAWAVGYREPAAFRRLFKRVTHLTPAEYRRRFGVPRHWGTVDASTPA